MKKKLFILALICAAAVAVSACGAKNGNGAASSETTAGAASGETAAASAEESKAAALAEDGSAAGADTESSADVADGMVNSIPSVGDKIGAFTVESEKPFDILGATLVTLKHEKSGGEVDWIANNDTERSFIIGFRTHYDTDTGVPHVFEHAAISGSEKYPDSGLFFNMNSQVYETYLNATTSVNWTDFKGASLSDKQLLKIADVLLAGAFEPLVLTDKHAMMREAYRYELPDADSDISLVGTVYTEMLGSYYSNGYYMNSIKEIWPGSWYGTCTGGKPGVIEEMTQQDLIDYHDTYYQPANAVSVLYGDLDLTQFLELIGSYYDDYTKTEVSMEDPGYTPFTGYSRVDRDVPASESESADATLMYVVPLRGCSDKDVFLLSKLFGIAVNNNSSALYNSMLKQFPDSSFSVSLQFGAEPMLKFELDYAEGVDPDAFVAAVKDGLAAVLEEGIHYEALESALKSLNVSLLTVREDNGLGITFGESLIEAYATYGDPSVYVDYINVLLNEGEEWTRSGILETVIKDELTAPKDSRLIVLTKKPGSLEEINEQAAKKLADMKAGMSADEIQAMVDETADYTKWADEQEAVSMIDEVKALTPAELPEEVKTFTAEDETKTDGVRYVTSDTGDSRLISMTLNFDSSAIPAADLARYSTLVNQLGFLPTKNRSYDEVIRLQQEYGIEFACTSFGPSSDLDEYSPVFRVSITCLREDLKPALALVWEILNDTAFDNADLIRYFASATANESRQSWGNNDQHLLALYYARASAFAWPRYAFETDYTPFFRFNETVGKMDDTALAAETESWQKLLSSLLNRRNMDVTVVSGEEGISEAEAEIESYVAKLPDTEQKAADYSELAPIPKSVALVIPGSANYNVKVVPMSQTGVSYSGGLQAVSEVLTDKVLFPTMRYRNGVYSPMSTIGRNFAAIMAYRDPSISVTYDEVLPTLGDSLREMKLTQEELDSYIISAYSSLAMPVGPIKGAETAVNDILNGDTSFADRIEEMKSLRALTPDDLAAAADIYDKLASDGITVTAGSAADIEKEKDRFETIENWYAAEEN